MKTNCVPRRPGVVYIERSYGVFSPSVCIMITAKSSEEEFWNRINCGSRNFESKLRLGSRRNMSSAGILGANSKCR